MKLSSFVANHKQIIYDDLLAGHAPRVGQFDETALKEARAKGRPQMGTTVMAPESVSLEYIYTDTHGATQLVSVKVDAPERIVFLPVPGWVIENIWQGDVAGSFHFETDAKILCDQFLAELDPANNLKHFGPQAAKRRE